VNSDDPSYFGGYINANFAAIQDKLGIGDVPLWEMARNSFTAAFLPQDVRDRYVAELDQYTPKSDRST
jgi:adenosine deaminase